MGTIWTTVTAPILVAVIGALLILRLTGPESSSVEAYTQYIDHPNPLAQSTRKTVEDAAKCANTLLPDNNFNGLIFLGTKYNEVRLLKVDLKNNSNIRSKEIEVKLERASLFSSSVQAGQALGGKELRLKPLDPGASSQVWAWLPPSVFGEPQVTIVHDNRRIDPASKMPPEFIGEVFPYLNRYPAFSIAALVILSGFGLLFLALIPIGIAVEWNPKVRYRLMSKKEITRLVQFVDFVRANHPEDYPKDGMAPHLK